MSEFISLVGGEMSELPKEVVDLMVRMANRGRPPFAILTQPRPQRLPQTEPFPPWPTPPVDWPKY